MFTPDLFHLYFGDTHPTIAKGLAAITSKIGTLVSDISLSQLQIEHLVFGQFASFHGKTKASHISIVLFARNKTIAVDADLHLAVNRFATIARAVFGNHVGYAMATFYQFVFKYLTPVSIRPNATPRISLEQHVDLFNQSMFHVGNSPGAQHADSPLNRWVIGFDEVLKDHELIDRLREENVHDILATVKANSQKTSRKQGSPSTTDATTANRTKRKGSTTSTAKSDTKKVQDKQSVLRQAGHFVFVRSPRMSFLCLGSLPSQIQMPLPPQW